MRVRVCVFYSCTIQSCNKSPVPKITDYNPVFTSRGALRAPVVLPDDLCARRGVLLVLLVATETCFLLPLARNGLQRGLVLGLDEIFRVLGHPPELPALVLQQKVAVPNLRGRRARRRASDQSPGEKRGGGGGVVETRTHRVSEATLRHRRVPRLALPVERLEIETSPSVSPWKGERTLFLFISCVSGGVLTLLRTSPELPASPAPCSSLARQRASPAASASPSPSSPWRDRW